MNTPPKPNFSISAQYLGPVFSLNGELTKHAQNLIFARNGTGKSFLSRAFRYLDQHGQGQALTGAARNLVSDESADGKGKFGFARGHNALGSLQLEKVGDIATALVADTIFHVFSEDFVHEELREQEYKLDGKIENQIAVDSVSIKLTDARSAIEAAKDEEQKATERITLKFNSEMDSELVEKAGVRRQLNEYKSLNFEGLLNKFPEQPSQPKSSFADILKDLDNLKSIPAEPVYPQNVDQFQILDIDLKTLAVLLMQRTSPSSVAVEIKKKIDAHHVFYEAGVAIVEAEHRHTCPFCEQGITSPGPKAIIDAYVSYFDDEEERHKSALRNWLGVLRGKKEALASTETQLIRQKSHYDDLKLYIPSKRETILQSVEEPIKIVRDAISIIEAAIQQKMTALSVEASVKDIDLIQVLVRLNDAIVSNNETTEALNSAVHSADEERKNLQRSACVVFEQEFAIRNWIQIENLRALRAVIKEKEAELTALERSAPSTSARSRVADTFELLLREFFADKYIFDKDLFVLRRGSYEMERGLHRTLSDGEKTAIAFCYFVACVHRKIAANSDYHKLFLVFDDPVTSMSYDFVFAIAQTLKNLSISDKGEVSLNPGLIDGVSYARPELLVLTHSTYFFNVARTNRVVKDEATFALHPEGAVHQIVPLKRYAAPFGEQLRDICDVANGLRAPDHSTGNTIRSVLEAIGRFCRPDKSESLSDFIQYVATEDNIAIRSVLINSLSHGTYYDEMPSPDDIKLACGETVLVVTRYAAGQIEILKAK